MTYPLPNVSHDLAGQVALVTGASSGLLRGLVGALPECWRRAGLKWRWPHAAWTGWKRWIASQAAYHYDGNGAALYSISKAAVVRMTEALSVEWARYGINVTAIAPGAFRSEMLDGMLSRMGDISQHFPRKRLGEPEQLDSTLLFLVSPASDAVTGTTIRVDDGQSGR